MFGFNNNKSKEKEILYKDASPKNANGYHCRSCKHCIECGYGNYSCYFGKPKLIVNQSKITSEYFWCNSHGYEPK